MIFTSKIYESQCLKEHRQETTQRHKGFLVEPPIHLLYYQGPPATRGV